MGLCEVSCAHLLLTPKYSLPSRDNYSCRQVLVGRDESLGTQIWPQILAIRAGFLVYQEH